MGYMKIMNLWKCLDVLLFKECWCLEKLHGTSAHISFNEGKLGFFTGEGYNNFITLFNHDDLLEKFQARFGVDQKVVVYGENFGGRIQGMSSTYGPNSKFVVFDIKINDNWMEVPRAEAMAQELGLEFVHYVKEPAVMERLDYWRDADSTQAIRNGMGPGHKREGIVIRPLIEVSTTYGSRIIAKHKRDDFRETKTPRVVGEKLKIIEEAKAIAEEWVVSNRLDHILQKLPEATGIEHTKMVISAMIQDIKIEAAGEFVESKEVDKEIATATAKLWKQRVMAIK